MKTVHTVKRALKKRLNQFQEVEFTYDAILGRADGVVEVPGAADHVYVRRDRYSPAIVVYNNAVQPVPGGHVRIGRTHFDPGILQVLHAIPGRGNPSGMSVKNHASTHFKTGIDPTYSDWSQIVNCLTYAKTGMVVHINSGILNFDGQAVALASQNKDLTSYIPDSEGAIWALLVASKTGAVTIDDSMTPVDSVTMLRNSNFPPAGDGLREIAAVKLYYGQTALSKDVNNPDVVPLVFLPDFYSGGSAGSVDLTSRAVGYGDDDGKLTGDVSGFNYDHESHSLTVGMLNPPDTLIPRIAIGHDGGGAGLAAVAYGGTPVISGWAANGTLDTPASLDNGDTALDIAAVGFADGAFRSAGAVIRAVATQLWTSAHQGMKWVFQVCRDNEWIPFTALELTAKQAVFNVPVVQYTGTQDEIEALTGLVEGATAYATDIDAFGSYDGAAWNWGGGGPGGPVDASDVSYDEVTPGNWNPTPIVTAVSGALDQLAERVYGMEFSILHPTLQAAATITGNLTTTLSPIRIPNRSGINRTIIEIHLDVDTAPTGQVIICDVHKNGTTIFTNQAHRPQIADSAYDGSSIDIDVAGWDDGEYLQIQPDQIGSTIAGANLTVSIVYTT